MQMISQVMTRDVRFVSPQESVQRAAQLMDELNVGALPVCEGERLIGMVTDRDITVRATAAGRSPADAHVDEVMSTDVRWCFEDEPVDDVMRKMADTQIRRVPVVTHDDAHRLIGIVALGDLLTKSGAQQAAQAASRISSPSEPDLSVPGTRSDAGGTQGSGYDPGVSGIRGGPGQIADAPGGLGGGAGAVAAAGGTDAAAGAKGIQTAGSPGKVVKNSDDVERPEEGGGSGGVSAGVSGASGGVSGTAGPGGSKAGGRP